MTTVIVTADRPGDAVGDLELSRELLAAVARRPGVDRAVRVYRPRPTVAMTGRERLLPGVAEACRIAAEHGFEPVVRPTGGRAVVYDETCLVVDVIEGEHGGRADHRDAFVGIGDGFVRALRGLGVDARLGPVPGEYCPGDYSVNARDSVKLVGTAQRVVRRARLVGASLAAGPVEHLVPVLDRVNRCLGLEWSTATFGSVALEAPAVAPEELESAILTALAPGAERVALSELLAR